MPALYRLNQQKETNMFRFIILAMLLFFLLAAGALIYTLVAYGVGAFFQVFGILVAACLVGAIALLLLVRFVLSKFAKGLLGLLGRGGSTSPRRITLQKQEQAEWKNAAAVEQSIAAFNQLGFAEAGLFSIDELPSVKLQAFCHAKEGVYGVVYEAEQLGVWSDLVCHVQESARWLRLTYTNNSSPHCGLLDSPPDRKLVKVPGASVPALVEQMLAELPAGQRWAVSAGEFAQTFQRAWAEEIDWRNARGGPTEDEVRRVAALGGTEPTEEVLAATRKQLTDNALEQLDETLRDDYVAANPSAKERADDLVLIHDKLRVSDVLEKLAAGAGSDGRKLELPELPPRQAFAAANVKLPADQRFKLLGTVTAPIEADVYLDSE
jgi:hypothetical protein